MYKKPEKEDPQLEYARANHAELKAIRELLEKLVGPTELSIKYDSTVHLPQFDATQDTETR